MEAKWGSNYLRLSYQDHPMESLNSLSSRSLQYYVIARRWNADLEFIGVEAKFLRSLLDEYFFIAANKAERKTVQGINDELVRLDTAKKQLEESLHDQVRQLELMSEDVIPEDATALASKQIRLEYLVAHLFFDYKVTKKKIFALMRKALSNNRPLRHYNSPN
jgi:hypothetical protein